MKNTLVISQRAATLIFMSIASAKISVNAKGLLIVMASRMTERLDAVSEEEFSSLPGGEEIFRKITLAARRSRKAREAAAARKAAKLGSKVTPADGKHDKPARSVPEKTAEAEPVTSLSKKAVSFPDPKERPTRHPRLKIKCRYKPRQHKRNPHPYPRNHPSRR